MKHKQYSTQTEKIKRITPETLVIGVDIASQKHCARGFNFRKMELGPQLYFQNDLAGFRTFIKWLERLTKANNCLDVIVGMEPTGHYYFALDHYLKEKGIEVVLVNPRDVKRQWEVENNASIKSDPRDAGIIGKLLTDGRYSPSIRYEGVKAELREVIKTRDMLIEEKTRLVNQIHQWLSTYFPEYRQVFKTGIGKWLITLLKEAPTPAEIARLKPDGIHRLMQTCRRSMSRSKVNKLYELARQSIGIQAGVQEAKERLKMLLKRLEQNQDDLRKKEKKIKTLTEQIKEAKLLTDITGIGNLTAATFLTEVGDIDQYETPKQIEKLAGLTLTSKSSGNKKGRGHISKMGRKKLRTVLYHIALTLSSKNDAFKKLYHYYKDIRKKPGTKALIKLCCKLIRVLFTILKKGEPFDPEKMLADIQWPENMTPGYSLS